MKRRNYYLSGFFVLLLTCFNIVFSAADSAACMKNENFKSNSSYSELSSLYLSSLVNEDILEQKKISDLSEYLDEELKKKRGMFQLSFGKEEKDVLTNLNTVFQVEGTKALLNLFNELEIGNLNQNTDHKSFVQDRNDQSLLVDSGQIFKDLNIFCGDSIDLHKNVANSIDFTKTLAGKVQLRHMLLTPSNLSEKLIVQQNCLKEILNNQKLFDFIKRKLDVISTYEKQILGYWKLSDELFNKVYGDVYFKSMMLTNLNKNSSAMEVSGFWSVYGKTITKWYIWHLWVPLYFEFFNKLMKKIISNHDFSWNTLIKYIITCSLQACFNPSLHCSTIQESILSPFEILVFFSKFINGVDSFNVGDLVPQGLLNSLTSGASNEEKLIVEKITRVTTIGLLRELTGIGKMPCISIITIFCAIPRLALLFRAKSWIIDSCSKYQLIKFIHEQVANVANYFCAINDLYLTIAGNDVLNKFFANEINEIKNTFIDSEANSFLKNITDEGLKKDMSFYSLKGNSLASFKLFTDVKDRLVSLIKLYGTTDALMSIATLHDKFVDHQNVRFCFPEIIKNSVPYLKCENFWHTQFNPDRVVLNSLEIGNIDNNLDENGNPRGLIITGPNAAGKSTFLKNAAICTLFAQTIGISPCEKMVFTPFRYIGTSLNIVDTIDKESLFEAQKNRIKKMSDLAFSMKNDEFSFLIFDELYNGTSPEQAVIASYATLKRFITNQNLLVLFSTHFWNLTDLEQDTFGAYGNVKVSLDKDEDSGLFIKPTYKVTKGIANQKNAIDMLKKENIDNLDIQQAIDKFGFKK